MRCVVLDDYQGVALSTADWSVLADRVEVRAVREHLADEDAVVRELADADAVVVMRERTPLPASLFARLPGSGWWSPRACAMPRSTSRPPRSTASPCAARPARRSPRGITWALILGLARHVAQENAAFHAGGPWQSTVGTELAGRRLGILGLGSIGERVARVGAAFGMEVAAWSQNLTRDRTDALGVELAPSLADLARDSDVLTVHLVLGERTRGILGRHEIGLMRPTAFLVNTARSALVDGAALVEALMENRIAGAGLDVFDREPLPADDVLRTLPNVLATPHLGYVARDNYRTYFTEAVEDIGAFLAGKPIRVLTSKPSGR